MLTALVCLMLVAAEQAKPPAPAAPANQPAGIYDVKRLGLGTAFTVVVAFAAENCAPCRQSIPFYKTLLSLPRMDGKAGRLVVVATDGVWPVKNILDPNKLEPHRLTSGPYPARRLPGVTAAPTVVLIDRTGTTVGKWEGPLSAGDQEAIVKAINRLGASKGRQR